jgi:phosphomannomutase/phosphoglucomutase
MEAFKAYDIRGRIPDQLNVDIAYKIGRAFAQTVGTGNIIVGYDIRLDSPTLAQAVTEGLRDGGCDVLDIGLCGTEEVYFQTFHRQATGGVMVTASHNPIDYNGMKLVREQARPISADTGLKDIEKLVEANAFEPAGTRGTLARDHDKSAYIKHLLGYMDVAALKSLKIVVNAGNGGAGAIIDLLAPYLPFEFVRMHHEPDGHFPHGIPNPLLMENREATASAVLAHGADFGIAWDGDFDRCFLFDARGNFIEGYYIVGLLGAQLLDKHPGGKVVHDPRLTWNTIEMVEDAGGKAVQCKSGHAFIKERMRAEDAIYGGEMSAHHYFRDFSYCDSGMIPWLLVAERVCKQGTSLEAMLAERVAKFPCSGEINFKVSDAKAIVTKIEQYYAGDNPLLDRTDGVSMEFADWRFNVRSSNTEPLLRLNVETRSNPSLLERRTQELRKIIES